MSVEAIAWALNHAPIPRHRRDASSLTIVLVGLANHADPTGHNAFPAIATLVRYTRLSERTVHYALRSLQQLGLITPSDPNIIAAHITRADRRPNGWNLTLHPSAHKPVHKVVHNPDGGVHRTHPAPAHEVQTTRDGVHTTTPRGAATAPEPSQNHPGTHPRTRAAARIPHQPHRALPAPCGHCDARPGDPPTARIIWLDHDRQRSQPCPHCHPTTTPPTNPATVAPPPPPTHLTAETTP